jgi:transcriptional regulator with XRE-family HTH domain
MIKAERLRQGLSPKVLAKKGGISESYLVEVESGKKIIADKDAARLLKLMGRSGGVLADFEAQADGMQAAAPARPRQQLKIKEAQSEQEASAPVNESWLAALSGAIQAVPIKNTAMHTLKTRPMPLEGGKIAGAAPDKVFFLEVPDDSMAGYRIRRGDLALIAPAPNLKSDAYYLIEAAGKVALRKITVQDQNRVLAQWYDFEPKTELFKADDVKFIGQVKKIEFEV